MPVIRLQLLSLLSLASLVPTAGVGAAPAHPGLLGEPGKDAYGAYAGSASCKECHAAAYAAWLGSHHGRAERPMDAMLDNAAFAPERRFVTGTQETRVFMKDGRYWLEAPAASGRQAFEMGRALGVSPLVQFLTDVGGGRWQCTEHAWDPAKREWFDVYGDEDRKPGEWGHWQGRGMTWNTMCGMCHNTAYDKGYDAATDTFDTRMLEHGVGCESCHGPMKAHVDWQGAAPGRAGDPTPGLRRPWQQWLATCASCHARRGELDGRFMPGGDFEDHYLLTIAGEAEFFWPDGQIRDEDYEVAPFLGSRMHAKGVRCIDCHDAHTYKVATLENALCQRCHGVPASGAIQIDPVAHIPHPAGPGANCVDCHMPQTVYMARHWRRDHGFTCPDPLLTREFGIPNACSKCHADKGLDWNIEWSEKWYGAKLAKRPSRERSRLLAQGCSGDASALPGLSRLAADPQTAPIWRAVVAAVAARFPGNSLAREIALKAARDPDPLVRSKAVRALESFAQGGDVAARAALVALLEDSHRAPRVEAALALPQVVREGSRAWNDVQAYLKYNADMPTGRALAGQMALARGDAAGSIREFRMGVRIDPGSAELRQGLAVAFSAAGDSAGSLRTMREAVALAPRDAGVRFRLALALNEAGSGVEAEKELAEAVALDPAFDRAWANLAFLRDRLGRNEEALSAYLKAEALDRASVRIPHGRAYLLIRMGRIDQAESALREALRRDPAHAPSRQLLDTIERTRAGMKQPKTSR